MVRCAAFALALLVLASTASAQQDPLADAAAMAAWSKKLDQPRRVVDRVVVCFDEASWLREVSRWDAERFWPVLLWESDLVPKFVEAFRPKQILLAKYEEGKSAVGAEFRAIGAAWGMEVEGTGPADFLAALRGSGRAPLGVVLLEEGSPELLGGVAIAAGRYHVPMALATEKKHATRATAEEVEALRRELIGRLSSFEGVRFSGRCDDLDFVTVANDMPFAYVPSDPEAHGGAYTVDDAIARNDDLTRWGWVGRLVGGPARSVYSAMGALFLQPEKGLFFSRYDPASQAFGPYDPQPALAAMREQFPTEMIQHPDATLARWRSTQWPAGNLFGFVFVNSSGGATSWSTSKGGATHFDVPDTVPCVVHYTHSGSAGRPFDVDSIAGRWMANGAFVYFGSHAEPYLSAFVSPRNQAERIRLGVPFGAAMRHLYSPRMTARVNANVVGGGKKPTPINLSGPWKLAYFGDPSYRLVKPDGERVAPGGRETGQLDSFRKFASTKPRAAAMRAQHEVTAVALGRIDPGARKIYDDSAWGRTLRKVPEDLRDELQRDAVRAWIASLRADRDALYDPASLRKLAPIPKAIRATLEVGVSSPDAARHLTELAKEVIAGLDAHAETGVGEDPARARWVLEVACAFVHTKGSAKPFYAWVKQACERIGVMPADLRKAVLARKWIPDAARKAVEGGLK